MDIHFIARCYMKLNRSKEALKIKKHPKIYINETFTNDLNIYDILAVVSFNNGNH